MKKRMIIVCFAFSGLVLQCVHLKQATTQFDQGQYTESIRLCKTAIAADSTNSQAWLLLSKNYIQVDSLNQAVRSAERAFHYQPQNNSVLKHLSTLYIMCGNIYTAEKNDRHAIEYYLKARKIASEDTVVIETLASCYYHHGQLDRARSEYEILRLLVINQQSVEKKLEIIDDRRQKADAAVQKGMTAIRRKHYQTAINELNNALKARPDHQEAKYQLHMAEGHALYKKGSKSALWEAIEAYGLAMTLNDTLAEPHFWLAKAYERKDDHEFTNAIDEYTKVLELEPNGPFAAESRTRLKELKKKKAKLDKFWGR